MNYPHTTALLWNRGLAMQCDYYDFQVPLDPARYSGIPTGALVWVRSNNLRQFQRKILPGITEPFVLISADGDGAMPQESGIRKLENFLADPRLIHWFAQNYACPGPHSPKISPLPIGIDFHTLFQRPTQLSTFTMSPQDQERQLLEIRDSAAPTPERIARVFADFQFTNSSRSLKKRLKYCRQDRADIFRTIRDNPAFFFLPDRLPRQQYWREMAQHQFVISPHGFGLDCHRTWEALALGCYVIVESSSLDPLYQGLPVKIVDRFNDVSTENLKIWAGEFTRGTSPEFTRNKISAEFWLNLIRTTAADHACPADRIHRENPHRQ